MAGGDTAPVVERNPKDPHDLGQGRPLWREHLVMLEHLRQVIGLRGYGQRDPLNEYKAEAFALFEA